MPSRSVFAHLLPKAVEKRERCPRDCKVMPCSCPCSWALPCAGARCWGRRGGCSRHWDKSSCQFWGNPDPQECLMEGGGCSAQQQPCPCRCHSPPGRDLESPPSLWSISVGHWGARCGCPSSHGVHVQRNSGWSSFPLLCPWFPPSPQPCCQQRCSTRHPRGEDKNV